MNTSVNPQDNPAASSSDNGSPGLTEQRTFRDLADALRCGVCILDNTYRILYSNPTVSRMLGSPASDLVGERFVTLMAYDTELPQEYLDQHLEQQKPFDAAFRHLSSHTIWCAMTLSRLSSSGGRLILAQLEDVTQQKGDNTSLLSVDKHYLRLFAQFIKAGGVIFDQDLRYQDVYGNFYRPGFTPANIEGLLVSEIFPRDIADDLSVLMRQALAGEFAVVEREFQGRFHRLVFTPQQNAQGQITHGIMLVQNLTEAKFAEVSLRESEQLYRIVFETFFDGLIITVDGVIVDVNPAVERMTGYKQGELVGRLPETIVPPEWLALIRDSIQKQQTHILESAFQRKDGSIFPVEVQTTTIPYKGQIARLTAVRDVTERKEAEKQIRLLATVVRDSKAFIALTNLDGEILYINPYGLQLVGLLPEELTSTPSFKVLDFFNQPNQTIEIWQAQIAELGRVTCQDGLKSRDGILIPVERIMNGVYDDQQRPIAIAVIANDIRERQQLEIERLESHRIQLELEKANELRQHKDFFLSVVSHELRTPLTVIRTSADILYRHYDRLSPEKRDINFERILSHIDKLNEMIGDILLISRSEMNRIELLPQAYHLDKLCQEIAANVARAHPKTRVEYRSEIQNQLFNIDPYLVEHILSNLLGNAAKYSPEGGKASLHVSAVEGQVRFEIQDNGIGIPTEDLEYIFDPFHRAHNVGKILGTGMGLAIVKRFVDLHRGLIECRSKVGLGTTFTVILLEGEIP